MRAFVAVPVPPALAAAAARLAPDRAELRRVRPEHMHLTLAFLGDLAPERLAAVVEASEEATRGRPAFPASLDTLGRFPPSGMPRVLWLGVGRGGAELAALADRVRSALQARGVPFDEKPFRPHLTLARVREGAGREAASAIDAALRATPPAPLEFRVEGLVIVESALGPQGPRYTPRGAAPLEQPTGRA